MQEKIKSIIQERHEHWKRREDSWDPNKGEFGEYTIEEPEEIHLLGNQIADLLSKHRDELTCDFIIESYTMLGAAPQVIYDDNGHFAVTDDGMSSIPMTEDGKFDGPESFTAIVEPEQWKNTIREALYHYIDNY